MQRNIGNMSKLSYFISEGALRYACLRYREMTALIRVLLMLNKMGHKDSQFNFKFSTW